MRLRDVSEELEGLGLPRSSPSTGSYPAGRDLRISHRALRTAPGSEYRGGCYRLAGTLAAAGLDRRSCRAEGNAVPPWTSLVLRASLPRGPRSHGRFAADWAARSRPPPGQALAAHTRLVDRARHSLLGLWWRSHIVFARSPHSRRRSPSARTLPGLGRLGRWPRWQCLGGASSRASPARRASRADVVA